MSSKRPSSDKERKHLFDNPRNVRTLVRLLFGACIALVAVELVFHRHVIHPFEGLFGFYALYGFVACVILVLIAKEMRKVLMRSEDYYESMDE